MPDCKRHGWESWDTCARCPLCIGEEAKYVDTRISTRITVLETQLVEKNAILAAAAKIIGCAPDKIMESIQSFCDDSINSVKEMYAMRAEAAIAELGELEKECPACRGTGWYGQNGPGAKGHGDQWQACDQCDTGRAQKFVSKLINDLGAEAESAKADLAAAQAENDKLRKSHLRLIGHVCEALGHLHMNFRSKAIDTLTEATRDNDISAEFVALRSSADDAGRVLEDESDMMCDVCGFHLLTGPGIVYLSDGRRNKCPSCAKIRSVLASLRARAEAAEAALAAARTENERLRERRFPIQGGPSIPWRMIMPHEAQAKSNHDQTLERLAERGGLSPCEALAILDDMSWTKSKWRRLEAQSELERRRATFEDAAIRTGAGDTVRMERVERIIRKKIDDLEKSISWHGSLYAQGQLRSHVDLLNGILAAADGSRERLPDGPDDPDYPDMMNEGDQ